MEEKPLSPAARMLLMAGFAAALGAIAMPVTNPDLYWHLSAGRYIAENLSLPSSDFLSWTEHGAPWTDFEWLVQVIYYGIYSLAGKWGLFALKMALLGATFPVFYSILALNGLRLAAFFGLPLWGLALAANSDLRPENFSVLFFAVLLWRLEAARVQGTAFPSSRSGYAGLALFFALWANLHAGFAYGLLLLASYAAGGLADGRLRSSEKYLSLRLATMPALSAFCGSLITPWGFRLYSILLDHASDSAALSRYLAEWAPASFSNPWHWPFAAFLFSSFIMLLLRLRREGYVPAAHLLALAWLGFEASRHARHIVFFSMAALVVSFAAAARLPDGGRLRRAGALLLLPALAYLGLFAWPKFLSMRTSPGEEAAGAAAYLRANAAELGGRKLYNPWTWGGYLGWALYPDFRVFTDGRYIFHKYLDPVSRAMTDQDTWGKFADERGFELVLFRRDYAMLPYGQRVRGETVGIRRPSYLLFMPEDRWALLYWDAFSVLFGRRGKALPRELKIVRPDDFDSVRLSVCSGGLDRKAVAAELELYYRAAAGAPSAREAGLLRNWLAAFPGSCGSLKPGQ